MKSSIKRFFASIAGVAMAIGVVAGVASIKTKAVYAAIDLNTEEVAFTLTAKSNSTDSDHNTEITSGPDNLFTNGSTYLSSASSSKVFLGASSAAALKFGSSSKKGTMTLNLKSGQSDPTYAPTKVIFSIAAANDTSKNVNLSLNGATSVFKSIAA